MTPVYYAHSYRERDIPVVQFFSELMQSEGLIASLDPPSDHLNSAKPERHLRSTDGMLAVVTAREGGVSQYILYEVSLCLRARKPLLVFVEDVLPNGLISPRVLQRRFSRKALLRQMREHRHAVGMLRSYIGEVPPPVYQPSTEMRKCLFAASDRAAVADRLQSQLAGRGYSFQVLTGNTIQRLYSRELHETINSADLAIVFVDSDREPQFFLGAMRAYFIPTILLSSDPDFHFDDQIPREYQAHIVNSSDLDGLWAIIKREIEIFEEEYVDLADQEQVKTCAKLLSTEVRRPGQYSQDVRNIFIEGLQFGDRYVSHGQTGSMGPKSTGTINDEGTS